MSLRYSEDGPEFPNALVDDLLLGEVVFLCGAGVSAPQLPGFGKLVDQVYARLGVEKDGAEQRSCEKASFEECLGSLSRRLSDPGGVYDAVAHLLRVPRHARLSNHTTLLRLSRSLDNRIALVTTNFDTMFERAVDRREGKGSGAPLSQAGQSLPPPGGADFGGIIHLHGRIEDTHLSLSRTNLVLTSAEYGDAYMRSGWAGRFLFDLARCRTLVLVGYSAGDAPVRYFLNVLEADRDRFTDLRTVYALDGVRSDRTDADAAWGALAVKPLPYVLQAGDQAHEPLWRDLRQLAELVERPKASSRKRIETTLGAAFDVCKPSEREAVSWALTGRRDLAEVVVSTTKDPKWFDFILEQKLWSDEDAAWATATWCSRKWRDLERLEAAIEWRKRLRRPFGQQLEFRLQHQPPATLIDPWRQAWRLIAVAAKGRSDDTEERAYSVGERLKQGLAFDIDRKKAVRLLAPWLQVSRIRRYDGSEPPKRPRTTGELLWARLEIADRGALVELLPILLADHVHTWRVAQLATEELRSGLLLAGDAGLFDGYDRTDHDVPSIEQHAQNEHHEGFLYIVRLLADLLPTVAAADPLRARRLALEWRDLGRRLGVRLWLHALRRADLFTEEDAAKGLLELGDEEFWEIRREWVLAAEERLRGAPDRLVEALVARINTDGPRRYEAHARRSDIKLDWVRFARDQAMWLRLSAISRAGVLSDDGAAALETIKARQEHLQRDYTDRDLFSIYSSGVRSVVGSPGPLLAAAPAERLDVAHELAASGDPDHEASWSAYCGADPAGALKSLKSAPLSLENAALWSDFVEILARRRDTATPLDVDRAQLLKEAFDVLEAADAEFLQAQTYDLVHGYLAIHNQLRPGWWTRLWEAAEVAEQRAISDNGDGFYGSVINSAGGRLAESLLQEIDERRQSGRQPTRDQLRRLDRVLRSNSDAGRLGRGACVQSLPFTYSIAPQKTWRLLGPVMAADTSEGAGLRAILVELSRPSPVISRRFKAAILRGVEESGSASMIASHVAAKVLLPVYHQLKSSEDWGISGPEARRALSRAGAGVREGAAIALRAFVLDGEPATAWREIIGPLFKSTWPAERKHKSAELTYDLASLCVAAGGAFPEALGAVRHYLKPFERDWVNIHFLGQSEAPEVFPRESLDLLWAICGPPSTSRSTELAKVLDRIAAAQGSLEIDRRFQWLEERAFRHS